MTTALNAIAFKAQTHAKHRFQNLYGQLNTDALYRAWGKRKIAGFRNYFALPDNSLSVGRIYDHILNSLYVWLNRRSGRKSYTWTGMKEMLRYFDIQSMRVSKRHIVVDWY